MNNRCWTKVLQVPYGIKSGMNRSQASKNLKCTILILPVSAFGLFSMYGNLATVCSILGSNPGRSNKFIYSPKRPGRLWGSYSIGNGASFPGLKRRGSETHYSPLSSSEVKNELIFTSVPSTCLYGVYRDNLTFYLHVSFN